MLDMRAINKQILAITEGKETQMQIHAYVGETEYNEIDVEIYFPEYGETITIHTYTGIDEHEQVALKDVNSFYKKLIKKYPTWEVVKQNSLLYC